MDTYTLRSFSTKRWQPGRAVAAALGHCPWPITLLYEIAPQKKGVGNVDQMLRKLGQTSLHVCAGTLQISCPRSGTSVSPFPVGGKGRRCRRPLCRGCQEKHRAGGQEIRYRSRRLQDVLLPVFVEVAGAGVPYGAQKPTDDGWSTPSGSPPTPPGLPSTPQSSRQPYTNASPAQGSWAFRPHVQEPPNEPVTLKPAIPEVIHPIQYCSTPQRLLLLRADIEILMLFNDDISSKRDTQHSVGDGRPNYKTCPPHDKHR